MGWIKWTGGRMDWMNGRTDRLIHRQLNNVVEYAMNGTLITGLVRLKIIP
jgi:hypothetical protein